MKGFLAAAEYIYIYSRATINKARGQLQRRRGVYKFQGAWGCTAWRKPHREQGFYQNLFANRHCRTCANPRVFFLGCRPCSALMSAHYTHGKGEDCTSCKGLSGNGVCSKVYRARSYIYVLH